MVKKLRKIIDSPYFFVESVIVVFFLVLFIFRSQLQNKYIEDFINFFGTFIATVLGVFLSLFITIDIEQRKENIRKREVSVATLKLIYSELDINEMNIKIVREHLESMPPGIGSLYDNYSLLWTGISTLKTKSFYGVISSGAIQEITTKPKIFNSVQQAYFNMELSISAFNSTRMSFKDLTNFTEEERVQCLRNVENTKKNLDRLIKITERAKKIVKEYLELKGVKISEDSEIKNL